MKKKTVKWNKLFLLLFRAVLIAAGGYYLFMFLAPLYGRIANIGTVFGLGLSGGAFLTGLLWTPLARRSANVRQSGIGRRLSNCFFVSLSAGLFVFTASLSSVMAVANSNTTDQSTVIVLGCAVWGETPSYMLRARVNQAASYLEEHPDAVAILSGGQGERERISEAECMRRLMVEHGIEESRLYLEEESTNTKENIAFSKQIIEDNGLSSEVAIATSDYHLKRATMIARRSGLTPARIAARSGKYSIPTFFVRDALGVLYEFILGGVS